MYCTCHQSLDTCLWQTGELYSWVHEGRGFEHSGLSLLGKVKGTYSHFRQEKGAISSSSLMVGCRLMLYGMSYNNVK
jgi:hypothetical protein